MAESKWVGIATVSWLLANTLAGLGAGLGAQGPTTAAISGRVTDETGRGLALAEIIVTNRATGSSIRSRSRAEGRYLVAALEVGGPYSITVRRIGSRMATQNGLYLNLGQALQLDFQLGQQAIALQAIETHAVRSRTFSRARMGTETFIPDSSIHRLPIVNRDLYDLVKMVPQMSTWSALTASGANPRVNSYRIDGVSDQGLVGGNVAGAINGGKAISLEAVKEYQVLLSPFDVRQGNFAGAVVNAVTRSGTNEWHGSAFSYATNERLGRNVAFIRDARYEKAQFGFSLGGPIVKDRLHVFVVPEFQQRLIPATGPYVGQDAASETPLPVHAQVVARFQRILAAKSLDGGSAGAVNNRNPTSNVFVRLDAPLPGWNSRVVLRGNFARADSSIFARPTPAPNSNCPTSACFALSSLRQRRSLAKRSLGVQLYSNFSSGASNELILSHLVLENPIGPTVRQPLVIVTVQGANGQPATLQSGTHELAMADSTRNQSVEVTDNLTIPLGSHRVTLGVTAQLYRVRRYDLRGAYGVWEFATLDSLEAGIATRYRVSRDFGTASTSMRGGQYAAYVGDDWDVTSRLSLTVGLRADVPVTIGRPPYLPAVDSLLHRRTDAFPSGQVQWSPRFGFNYDVTRSGALPAQLRGGVGMFTGRPPLAWLLGSFASNGIGTRTLRCGSLAGDAGLPPAFRTNHEDPPLTCANGQGFGAGTPGEIDVLDPHLRFPQILRASLAADSYLPLGVVGTVEGLYTRGVRALFFSSGNLREPTAVDRHGRVMYGGVSATGVASPNRISSRFGDVISIGNQSKDYAFDVTGGLQKTFAARGEAQLSFTYARARDVQSQRIVRPVLVDNWRFGGTVAGRQDDLALGISDFDQPYRLRASGTFRTPWQRWQTDLTFYYIGGSGLPYSYVAGGTLARGDLNADGATGNDPIYIPRSARDTVEIQFAGSSAEVSAQQAALERFIDGAACLRRQRGRIMARNSCRAPWMHSTNVAVRQTLPSSFGQSFALELQVFNFLNLLDARWGRAQIPTFATPSITTQLPLLSQVGQTAGPASQTQPIYRFDTTMRRYSSQHIDGYYQIQLAARYNF